MTDADTDGAHIQVLLLTFFYRYMKPLIDPGRRIILRSRRCIRLHEKQANLDIRYAWTDEQLQNYLKEFGKH